jgi:hypothetical protein
MNVRCAEMVAHAVRAADMVVGVPLPDELPLASQAGEIDTRLSALRTAYGQDCLSDFSFSNLYLFRAAHCYRLELEPYPCVTGVTYDGMRHALPLFDIRCVPTEVLVDLIGRYGCLFPIPAPAIALLDPRQFRWEAKRDDADYLYRSEDFRNMRGNRLRKKRTQINQLNAEHRIERQILDGNTVDDARWVLADWMRDKGKISGQADHDACLAAFNSRWLAEHEGWIWYADGTPAGFVMTQLLTPDVLVVRFAKGIAAYPGIYPLMFHELANKTSTSWLNFEQDLGLGNFRQSKLSYDPAKLLAKYRVTLQSL